MIRALAVYDRFNRRVWPREDFLSFSRYDVNLAALVTIALEIREHMPQRFEHIEIGRYRLSLLLDPDYTIVCLNDRVNEIPEIESYLLDFERNMLELTGGDVERKIESVEAELEKVATDLLSHVPVKICFVGAGGVGKTTIVRLLAEGVITMEYKPTIFADIKRLEGRIGPFTVMLFTVAGQEDYRRSWDVVTKATDIVFVVLDSTPANLRETKERILPQIFRLLPYSRYVAIANKQDLKGRLEPHVIEEELGLPTHPLIAIREDAKERLKQILTDAITQLP